MSDFEILSIVIGFFTVVIASIGLGHILASDKKHKKEDNRQ